MQVLTLEGRGGATVKLDHCDACRLVWFEPLEFDTLARPGWVTLLSHLVEAAAVPATGGAGPPPEASRCPQCDAALRAHPQATSFGRHVAHACPNGHGQAQRDGALLASRGLFRPLLLDERVALATERRRLHCLPCGAPLDGKADHCGFCGSPATVLDLRRLAQALDLQHRRRGPADAPLMPWSCHACGSPLDATRATACAQCRHPVLAPSLRDVARLLSAEPPGGYGAPAGATGLLAQLQDLTAGFWRRWLLLMACVPLLLLAAWCTAR